MTQMKMQRAGDLWLDHSGGMATSHGATLTDEEIHLYSPDCPVDLGPLYGELQRHGGAIVDRLSDDLRKLPGSLLILERLSAEEQVELKADQLQHLFVIGAPALTAQQHCSVALEAGRVRGIIGVDREGMARMLGMVIGAIHRYVDPAVHAPALRVLEQRLIRDLAWQAEAGQRLQALRQDTLLQALRFVRETDNYSDLIRGAVEILGRHEEFAGCSVGRPDHTGIFRFESASGATIATYLTEVETVQPIMSGNSIQARGPAGRAWHDAEVQRSINIATDPHMAPWQALAQRAGFRSCVAIPLLSPGHKPTAILSLYSAFPGGYTSIEQVAFVDHLQTLLGFSIARIEAMHGDTTTVAFATRQHLSALVRSDALKMYYQPLIDLKSGRVAKVEALARLQDGNRILAPGEFFPVLSSDDFLYLYERGLGQTLARRQQWLAQGFAVNVSVNVPPSALSDLRYFDVTQRALQDYRCAPEHLTLEILETDAFPLGIDVARELARLKTLGIQLAQDDLGSGHSSLARLREVPFDFVKIDRSVISMGGEEPKDVLRFVWQLIQLGHSLGKAVIVEGVESDEMLEAMVMLGADLAQGYGIARPMPAERLAFWLASRPDYPAFDQPLTPLGMLAQQLIHDEHARLSGVGEVRGACSTAKIKVIATRVDN